MHQFVNGRRVPGRGSEALTVVEPASGAALAEVDTASLADVDDAVAAANKAAAEMERLSFFERAELLHAAADRLEVGTEPLAEQLARESGKPLAAEAVDELAESADIFRLAAEEIKRLETHVLPSVDPRKRVFTYRKPNGVYALITPWNFPMNIPAELLAAALAAGNPAIIKPSENAAAVGPGAGRGRSGGRLPARCGVGGYGTRRCGTCPDLPRRGAWHRVRRLAGHRGGHRDNSRDEAHDHRSVGQRTPDRLRRRRPRGRCGGSRLRGPLRGGPVLRGDGTVAGPRVGT